MENTCSRSRRHFRAGAAMTTAAVCVGGNAACSASAFVIDVPDTVSMAVKGSDQRFPVRRVYCLGRNYRAHAIESGDNPDETPPFFFMKPRDAVVDSGDGFPYPPMTKGLRYEAEMVVALRSSGSDIKPASDLDHVYGYGIGLVEKGDLVRADIDGLGEIEVRII